MIKDYAKLKQLLVQRAQELGAGCSKVFVSVSGGIDSSLVASILCHAFNADNVVCMYRAIKSDKNHLVDVKSLQAKFGFRLIEINGDFIYDEFINQAREQFNKAGLPWVDESSEQAQALGFTNAYSSLKSRFTTPFAGFIAKAIDTGNGRIFGTGNGEEDGLLRYFDKFGDGAVDSNILNGLTKAEVKQLAGYMGVPEQIILKIPSADLEANGDSHNDESQLTEWAHNMGYSITVTYGALDGSTEGNIAWVWKEDIKHGVVTGKNMMLDNVMLAQSPFCYTGEQVQTILFMRTIEQNTRHKIAPIVGLDRAVLLSEGVVD